jgi:hypothetical protein
LGKARLCGEMGQQEVTALARSARRLTGRLQELEARLEKGDETAWPSYCDTVHALAAVAPTLSPEYRGALLTTAQMAERFGVTPKTLLKHKAAGRIRPAVQSGRMLRWRGDEALAHK